MHVHVRTHPFLLCMRIEINQPSTLARAHTKTYSRIRTCGVWNEKIPKKMFIAGSSYNVRSLKHREATALRLRICMTQLAVLSPAPNHGVEISPAKGLTHRRLLTQLKKKQAHAKSSNMKPIENLIENLIEK